MFVQLLPEFILPLLVGLRGRKVWREPRRLIQ